MNLIFIADRSKTRRKNCNRSCIEEGFVVLREKRNNSFKFFCLYKKSNSKYKEILQKM